MVLITIIFLWRIAIASERTGKSRVPSPEHGVSLLYLGNQDASPFWHTDVFINQDALLSSRVQFLLGLHCIDMID